MQLLLAAKRAFIPPHGRCCADTREDGLAQRDDVGGVRREPQGLAPRPLLPPCGSLTQLSSSLPRSHCWSSSSKQMKQKHDDAQQGVPTRSHTNLVPRRRGGSFPQRHPTSQSPRVLRTIRLTAQAISVPKIWVYEPCLTGSAQNTLRH